MWVLVLLLDLMGPKKFLRFLAGTMLIMLFFLYCFVHDAFDYPRPTPRPHNLENGTEVYKAPVLDPH